MISDDMQNPVIGETKGGSDAILNLNVGPQNWFQGIKNVTVTVR